MQLGSKYNSRSRPKGPVDVTRPDPQSVSSDSFDAPGPLDPQKDVTMSLDLVRQAQAGEDGALNRLFERYYDRVRRIVRLRLGRQLRVSLESADILQETFIAAVQSFNAFEMRDEASLINWLSKLAERQIIAAADYHGARKRDKKREVPLPSTLGSHSGDRVPVQFVDENTPAVEKLAGAEQVEIVESCIANLAEEYRELIILRNYAGASWDSVAEQTHRPSAAAARMMHARAMIELGKLVRTSGG